MWLGCGGAGGATIVGINPTRRGEELARDITHTECQLIVTEPRHLELLDGLDLGAADGRVLVIDDPSYDDALGAVRRRAAPDREGAAVDDRSSCSFTSGTTGAPKAVVCSHGRLDRVATTMAGSLTSTPTTSPTASMPLFHSNALFTAWATDDRGRGDAGAAAHVLRVGVPPRRARVRRHLLQLRRQAARVRPRHARATRRRRQPAATRVRQRRQPRPTCGGSTSASAARSSTGTGRRETGASISRVPGTPVGSLGNGRRRP